MVVKAVSELDKKQQENSLKPMGVKGFTPNPKKSLKPK